MNNYFRDIRGIHYTELDLKNNKFTRVQAGIKPIQKVLLLTLGITATSLCTLIPVISAHFFTSDIFYFGIEKNYGIIFVLTSIVSYVIALILLLIRGFETAPIIAMIGVTITSAIATTLNQNVSLGAGIFFLILSIISAWIGSVIIAFCVTFTHNCNKYLGVLLSLVASGITNVILVQKVIRTVEQPKPYEGAITVLAAFSVILVGTIIAQKALKDSLKFSWIKNTAVFWAATGGTSFYGCDLTDACFDGSDLRHTDFRKANLTRASFKDVTGLELARLQGTLLENNKVRKLLTTNSGRGEDFTGANLQGANLQGVDLREAILVKAQLLDADLSGAVLTDACIQDWNINHNTRFHNVDCKRVFLKRTLQGNFFEPKPDSGEFQAGEFEKWITEVRDTIDLIFQNGLNWRAFAFSLTQTAINNDGLGLSVRSIENKGDGIVVAKVGVSLETNKTAIHEEITNHYYHAVKAIESKYELILQAKDGEIERLTNFYNSQQQFMQGLITSMAETTREVTIKGEGNRVYMMNQAGDIMESNKQNINAGGDIDMSSGNKITVGGDVTNSNLTLADANSQVSNSIQQLKDVGVESSNQLAEILATLQKSITNDAALSENQKKEALEAVETIAEEGKKQPSERVMKLCTMALNALKGLTSAITDASQLGQALNTYLPSLKSILGL